MATVASDDAIVVPDPRETVDRLGDTDQHRDTD